MSWPSKNDREEFEISGFIKAYARLPWRQDLEVESRQESPDYIVQDMASGQKYGVELTAVYLNDRSVPDVHMEETTGFTDIPYDQDAMEQYKNRLVGAIKKKVCKARKGYDLRYPIILSIYVNEYISIYLRKDELEEFVYRYEVMFDSVSPFCEVVFWNLGNGGVFRVRPERGNVGRA